MKGVRFEKSDFSPQKLFLWILVFKALVRQHDAKRKWNYGTCKWNYKVVGTTGLCVDLQEVYVGNYRTCKWNYGKCNWNCCSQLKHPVVTLTLPVSPLTLPVLQPAHPVFFTFTTCCSTFPSCNATYTSCNSPHTSCNATSLFFMGPFTLPILLLTLPCNLLLGQYLCCLC